MSLDIILTITALAVAAVTSIVGIWLSDPRRAKKVACAVRIDRHGEHGEHGAILHGRARQAEDGGRPARMLVMLDQPQARMGAAG